VDCPGPRSLKEKLGLSHLERSVVAESTYLLVFHHSVCIRDRAFITELCKASTGERAARRGMSAPLECFSDHILWQRRSPPRARIVRAGFKRPPSIFNSRSRRASSPRHSAAAVLRAGADEDEEESVDSDDEEKEEERRAS